MTASQVTAALWQKKRKFVWDYKAESGCVDCGERDPVVLDFDHVDPATKGSYLKPYPSATQNSRTPWYKLSWVNLTTELEKVVVRCANCHRRRTAKQFNWNTF